ncbi:Uncharacterised protein [Yersinia enterocolitica]|nr:Uncharacterised protein [Yersinia enterocolitica]
MARSLACLGDKTTQGEIRSASSTWFEGLKAVAQSGDLAWCEVCKSSHQGRLFLQKEYGVFMIYLFSPQRALCQ